MRGYKDISLWVLSLGQKAGSGFRCRKHNGQYEVPSLTVIQPALVRINPMLLGQALHSWNTQFGLIDESLTIDDKTMCSVFDIDDRQTHTMSAIGYQTGHYYAQKSRYIANRRQ